MLRKQKTKLDMLVIENIREIKDFINTSVPSVKKQSASNEYKIRVECPYCNEHKKNLNLALNLDWGSFKCFRCGTTGSLITYLKQYNLDSEYIELLSNLSSITLYDIQSLLKSNKVIRYVDTTIKDDTENEVKKFIEEKCLIPIKKLKYAKQYALERVYNSEIEIESYYADDKYIYIPLSIEDRIVSFMARRYVECECPRYKMHTIDGKVHPIGFLDEVKENFTNNSLVITEGYFDAFAINYAFSNYISIALLGKNKITSILPIIENSFSYNTKVYIALDSIKKDKDITADNLFIAEKLIKTFPNTLICSLEDNDPSDILKEKGPLQLKESLLKNAMPFIKYKLLNSRRLKK